MTRGRDVNKLNKALMIVLVATGLLLLSTFIGSAAHASKLLGLELKNLPDRDVVVLRATDSSFTPAKVARYTAPSRVDVSFPATDVKSLKFKGLTGGTVKRIIASALSNSTMLSIELDQRDLLPEELVRVSQPNDGYCIIEILHPASDKAVVEWATIASAKGIMAEGSDFNISTPAVASASVEETKPAPVLEEPKATSNISANNAERIIRSIQFDPKTNSLAINGVSDLNLKIERENYPPSLFINLDSPIASNVIGFVTRNQNGFTQIAASNFFNRDGKLSSGRIVAVFDKEHNFNTEISKSSNGVVLQFVNTPKPIENPVKSYSEPTNTLPANNITPQSNSTMSTENIPVVNTNREPTVSEILGAGSAVMQDDGKEEIKEEAKLEEKTETGSEEAAPDETNEGYEFPEENKEDRLSDVLVNLEAAGGMSVWSVLNLMSNISGLSIIFDPYITDEPTGGRGYRPPKDPFSTIGGGGLGSGGGFRDSSSFNPGGTGIFNMAGTGVIGNFRDVPFDQALELILESNNLRKKIIRDPNNPYAKPIIYITSRERLEQETKGANSIEYMQLHYASPNQINNILYQLDLLPSLYVGWYVYARDTDDDGDSGSGGSGSGSGGSGGYGGSGRMSADFGQPMNGVPTSYFNTPMQGSAGAGTGGGGGGGGTGGGGFGGGTGGGTGGGNNNTGGIPYETAKSGLIIMRGTPETLSRIREIISAIDRPPKMVKVKVSIYRTSANPREVYGLLRSTATSPGGKDFDRININHDDNGITMFIQPKAAAKLVEDYSAAFDMLQANSRATVITETEITALDGNNASISNTRTTFNFRQQITYDANGNPQRSSVFDEVQTGIDFEFLPSIDDHGLITMYLNPSISSADGPPLTSPDGTAQAQPTTQVDVETLLRLRDGEAALIGGMVEENNSILTSGVPFLKDLPLIGPLFKHTDNNRSRSYIWVIVRPQIVKNIDR